MINAREGFDFLFEFLIAPIILCFVAQDLDYHFARNDFLVQGQINRTEGALS